MKQREAILKHLEQQGPITAIEALNFYGCFRLAARINELKNEGENIKSEPYRTPGGATISKYRLVESD